MTAAFFLLSAAYLLFSLWQNRYKEDPRLGRPNALGALIQSGLFLLAGYYAWDFGFIGRGLVHPGYVAAGLLVGHLIFIVSCVVTRGAMHFMKGHVFNLSAQRAFLKENPDIILRFAVVAFSEELIYRAAAQPLLIGVTNSPVAGILVVAVAFSVVHWHFFRNPLLESAEFVGFALLLGVLFHLSGNLTFVVLVHVVRNLEIVFIEYRMALEETGDPEAAQAAVEGEYGPRRMQQA